jgi:predicted Zn-dependent peptidase
MNHTVSQITLKNGGRGIIIDIPGAQVMSTQFHFRAGYRFVRDKSIYETAHIMEHMAFGASKRFKDAHAYEAEFTKNGAYHNAYTSDNSMCYVAECASFEWERILDLQKAAICEPTFQEDEFIAERGNVKSELTGYLNVPNRVLWPRMSQELGEDTLTYSERLKQLNDIKVEDIKEHYARTHTGGNLRFVIAGDFEGQTNKLQELLETWKLPEGERLPIPVDELHSAEPFVIRRKDAPNLTFGLSLVVPRRLSDDENDAMDCLNHILTGTLHSRMLGSARKKGIVYHMFSDTSTYEHNSSWDIGAQANVDDIDALSDIISRELKRVLEGDIDLNDVEAAKSYALGRHQMGAQTVGQLNSWYANRYFFDGRIEDFDGTPEKINAVKKEQIIETAQEFFATNCWVLGGYGNAEKAVIEGLSDKVTPLFELS